MEWLKVSIETTGVGVELITGALLCCGVSSLEIIDSQDRARFFLSNTRTWDYADETLLISDTNCAYVIFYVTNDDSGNNLLENVKARLQNLSSDSSLTDIGSLIIRQEFANDETWLNEWKKYFKPIHIGRVVVVPEWEEHMTTDVNSIIFKIDPGSAFGTGQHQTTQLCINALQKWLKANDKVLDIGCGSGILSIISLLLSASYVCAIDIDPAGAIAATKKNAKLNPVNLQLLEVLSGDVLTDSAARENVGSGYDIVVANIVADVIIPLTRIVKTFAKTGGLFIASGIIDERLSEVLDAFLASKIEILAQEEMENWYCIVGQVYA
jgi:ribosomal protein L11 methyltransferase